MSSVTRFPIGVSFVLVPATELSTHSRPST